MAKPTKHATLICIILTIIAAIGILLGLIYSSPLIPVILLLPTAAYEVYRTEGKSTKAASWGMLGLLIAQLLFVFFDVSFDLAEFLGRSSTYIRGYQIPFGDIKVISPTLMALLSVVLISNTRGRYTRWLAGIIFISAFGIIYTVDPSLFEELIRLAVNEGMRSL